MIKATVKKAHKGKDKDPKQKKTRKKKEKKVLWSITSCSKFTLDDDDDGDPFT